MIITINGKPVSDEFASSLPDSDTRSKLEKAAEIITTHLDKALQDCLAAGVEREHFTAAVIATMMQAVETSLGGNAAGALEEMAQMAKQKESETPVQ
tara:strand:- start:310 stop:600 length:291 start_codon:yes stop_codon:yes gene_type:complete